MGSTLFKSPRDLSSTLTTAMVSSFTLTSHASENKAGLGKVTQCPEHIPGFSQYQALSATLGLASFPGPPPGNEAMLEWQEKRSATTFM